ncbi:MAG: HPr family phosphocarrier protein [Gemmatimonadota bacterium]|jgi:phosphocarrier protein|nr:phosphocarrier protein HPr [Gemmatimonadota bacterium]MDP6460955.1 HPr family phosphocarrier protein [Gemmatimonadota bacterium]MDP6529948.1 HPr family phosphocarrier protein [Gemmatimonadota bacterium]MDP6802274.1 HPr family phosphocarrier protein [Gemmatimonadota bacterium]MDP7031992.1 HPr family phosphocarrier protein [Gemmatimonadota bacterium]
MIRRTVKIPNTLGMHMRAANVFALAAARYGSVVRVTRGELTVNGKSIMGLMMLAAPLGTRIVIEVEGVDEEKGVQELVDLVESGFGEGVNGGDA